MPRKSSTRWYPPLGREDVAIHLLQRRKPWLRGTSWTGGTLRYREVKWFAQHYTAMQWGAVLKINKSVAAVASSIYETVMLGCRITRLSQTLNNWIKRKGPRLKTENLWIVKFVKYWNNSLREYYWHFLSGKVLKYRRNTDWLTFGMGYPFWEKQMKGSAPWKILPAWWMDSLLVIKAKERIPLPRAPWESYSHGRESLRGNL